MSDTEERCDCGLVDVTYAADGYLYGYTIDRCATHDAAPRMLAALEALVGEYRGVVTYSVDGGSDERQTSGRPTLEEPHWQEAIAAIAEAGGGPS